MLSVLGALALLGVLTLDATAAPGSCGRGKVWDADQNKCVPKPRGSGSHSG
jgi:hypothetical protein